MRAPPAPRRLPLWQPAVLAFAVIGLYAGSLHSPFVFDDAPTLILNESIRSFWTAWHPPGGGMTASGRPLLNVSFALNYALSGETTWSYHAVNILIHLAASLALVGVLRRLPGMPAMAAFIAGLGWAVHPLQTESVTYIVQRAESLAGLFYLLTLYCFLRFAEERGPDQRWRDASIVACALGMMTKEIMVSAPIMVLLLDRTFLSGTLREAFARRGRYYLGLALTWLIQAYLVVRAGTRGGTAGFTVGIGWWQYWQTQFRAVCRYLGLSVWPHPLVIDYGVQWEKDPAAVAGFAVVVVALIAGTVWCLSRPADSPRLRAVGFAGAWIFLLLAPTSIVPGTRQTMAEHRMYLPLAALLVLLVLALARPLGKWLPLAALPIVLVLGWLTIARNRIYASEVTLWSDTVLKVPDNAWAWNNLGVDLEIGHSPDQAKACYERALALYPGMPNAANNLGDLAMARGDLKDAIQRYQTAIAGNPDYFNPRYSLGNAFLRANRPQEAAEQFAACLRIQPGFAGAELGWGDALAEGKHFPEAEQHLRRAIAIAPHLTMAFNDLGNVLLAQNRGTEAIVAYDQAIAINPNYTDAKRNRALAASRQR